jgi:hypothetical protein
MMPELPSFTWKKIQTLTKKEARITPHPIIPVNDFDKYFLPNPMTRKPINGKSGIK